MYVWVGGIKDLQSEKKKISNKRCSGTVKTFNILCLGIIRGLSTEFNVQLYVILVSTVENKMDTLSKVRKIWLGLPKNSEKSGHSVLFKKPGYKQIEQYTSHGVGRTLFLAKKVDSDTSSKLFRRWFSSYDRCQSIDRMLCVYMRRKKYR